MSTWASVWVPFSPKQYDIPLKKRARGHNCTALAAGWLDEKGWGPRDQDGWATEDYRLPSEKRKFKKSERCVGDERAVWILERSKQKLPSFRVRLECD